MTELAAGLGWAWLGCMAFGISAGLAFIARAMIAHRRWQRRNRLKR